MHDSMKQDALAWLDLQRDAVNTEIVYALQDEQKQYHAHLKIINWVAEAARIHGGEMTAEEYLRAKATMCDANESCEECALGLVGGGISFNCLEYERAHTGVAVEIVKKWKEEQDD